MSRAPGRWCRTRFSAWFLCMLGVLDLGAALGCTPPPKRVGATNAPWHTAPLSTVVDSDHGSAFDRIPGLARARAESSLAAMRPRQRANAKALRYALAASYIARGRARLARGAEWAAAADWRRATALGGSVADRDRASLQWRLALHEANAPKERSRAARRALFEGIDVNALPAEDGARLRALLRLGEADENAVGLSATNDDDVAALLAWLSSEQYVRLGYRLVERWPAPWRGSPQAQAFLSWYGGQAMSVSACPALATREPGTPFASEALLDDTVVEATNAALTPWLATIGVGDAIAAWTCDRARDDGACAYAIGAALVKRRQWPRAARWFAYAQRIEEGPDHQPSAVPSIGRAFAEAMAGRIDVAEQSLLWAETTARVPGIASAALWLMAEEAAPDHPASYQLFRAWSEKLNPPQAIAGHGDLVNHSDGGGSRQPPVGPVCLPTYGLAPRAPR